MFDILWKERASELDRLKKEHARELDRLKKEHVRGLDNLKKEHHYEIACRVRNMGGMNKNKPWHPEDVLGNYEDHDI